ncbi:hypothetical protein [Actinomadura sp. DC4]|uniref:hypothetical protein n=1 Tax=Actinomadura sp. DC4 TaxID=3055069 RepID=UPI0025AF2F33|nr:hypothetical protein [Actinomadura sp. DC4]MDN3354311.1 hypothetical protein [Actinomadura sp. DC4]
MGTPEERDRRVSMVRRVTIWVSVGSLAAAGVIGAILGVGRPGAADTTSTTTSGSDTTSGPGGGFTTSTRAPGASSGAGGVTSGGS